MSSCSTSKRKPTKVVSKYFNDCKTGMDESLTEFQEPKKNVKGPKTGNTTKAAVKPRKKVQKKIKGQKDIKTAFQKNEIVEFTEDFNRICAQSGVDVDAEQLQLAIALSKSLHNTEINKNDEPDNPIPTTSQQRSGKVRSTLLEYGFKVPEVKIDYKNSRRLKKYKKNSLLLLKSEEEKRQNITDKYSQVIFDSLVLEHEKYDDIEYINEFNSIYNKATNTKYEEMRNNKCFYIEDLIEVSTESIGSLLKDWSNIPGRPKSPISKSNKNIQVSKIEFSEAEIDILLSGKLIDAQKIVFQISKVMVSDTMVINNDQSNNFDSEIATENKDTEEKSLANNFMNQCDKDHDLRHIGTSKKLVYGIRSPSPDLFDDDISVEVSDNVTEADYLDKINILSNTKECSNLSSANREVMVLTACENEKSSSESLTKTKIQVTENIVVSDDISNKLMEVSNYISNDQDSNHEQQIDLTQNSDHENDVTIVKDCKKHDKLIVMDSSESEDDETSPYVEISGQKPIDCFNGSLNIRNTGHDSKSQEPSLIILDEDDNDSKLDEIEIVATEKSGKKSRASNFEEYSYNHSDDGNNLKLTIDLTNIEANKVLLHLEHGPEIDLTQSPISLERDNSKNTLNSSTDPKIEPTQSYSPPAEIDNLEISKETNVMETHDGISAIYDDVIPELEDQYDNIYDRLDVSITETFATPVKYNNASNLSQNRIDSSQKTINTDAESEVFEISDEELNYSVHNSKYNLSQDNVSEPEFESPNFDLGGISVINNLSSAQNSLVTNASYKVDINKSKVTNDIYSVDINKSKVTNDSYKVDINKSTVTNDSYNVETKDNETRNDSFLPAIEIAGTKRKSPKKIATSNVKFSLEQGCNSNMVMNTPNNSGFIVKTSEVTPLVDYASLTTPERNRELDKYGLKPFKRKRAIQLLTHLYNQTHPIVEVTKDLELTASPAKKRKPDCTIFTGSPKKPATPKELPLVQGSTFSGVTCYETEPVTSQRSPKRRATPREFPILQGSTSTGATGFDIYDKPGSSILQWSPKKHATPKKSPLLQSSTSSGVNNRGDLQYEVTNFPPLNEVECCPDDWVFQKREKAKISSCRVPLHIAFYNYVSSCQKLRESILRYEPVNIDVIHKDLVASGHRYDPKDLLKYLDKKCIAVKTAETSTRNEKKSRQQL